jgi:hypothetical protein
MMIRSNESHATQPTVKYVIDSQGRGWICDADADSRGDLCGQGCVAADEWIYDRNFGG